MENKVPVDKISKNTTVAKFSPIKEFRVIDPTTGEVILEKKQQGNGIKRGFVMTYQDFAYLMATENFSKLTYRVALYLLSSMDWDGLVMCTSSHIAEALSADSGTVRKALKNLREINFITDVKRGGYRGFLINPTEAFKNRGYTQAEAIERWEEAVKANQQRSTTKVMPINPQAAR